ncbi:unnamed protein product [Lampetra planeri]
MHDLTAQVTSSLLPFPAVTVEALGEDEITLDSVLHGKFTIGRGGLAWLACGPHLEVVHAVTGERLSAYCFTSGTEHPPTVLAARDFSWLKRSGLLVGLEEAQGSVLCLYDLGLSRVVKSVVIPGRITVIEPLVSYGGASTSTQHLHQSLRWFFGIAAVVTDLGHVLLVDLGLDDLSCNQSELEASDLQVVTKSPAEIPRLREVSSREGRHLCLQLNGSSGVGATALQYISRTNQLAVGFSDGYLQIWNMKTLKKEYHSQLEGGRVPVHAFTYQEPENDPRNCCYLWAVQSSQDLEGDVVSLHLLQLAFSERKCLASGKILYEGLEYCEERYSQELNGTAFPLRAQTTSTRLLSCQTIEKFRPHPDRDDNMNEVASPDTSVSIFSWQIKAYGQGPPSTYIGVFDINRWYHAQMPDSLRVGESLQNCPYLAVWNLDPVTQMVSPHVLLDVVVHDRSLSRGMPLTCPPPEQYFNPTTYNFDATCLLNAGIVHSTCSGYQKETLSFLKKAAPCSSEVISSSYSRCLMSGLLPSRLSDTQASNLTQEEQLDAILSTAVETSSLGLITGCIKQWTAEEQPGSALNLHYILDWAWNKVVQTKEELDGICAPLFDSSSNFTDPQTMQLLQHSQRLLGNLSTIFHCLLSEAQELTQKGVVGLMNKNMVSGLISKYAEVVLWFCRTGLLPEGSDDDAPQFSRPFYTHSVISNYYTIRREDLTRLAKGKWCADCLMIDGLVGQCGERLTNLWKRDEGGTGQYPPPTLHALLDIYLLDNIDESSKHAIVIYLLLDVMYAFPNKDGATVESFPTAFAIPMGLVKLVQGLWLLDHHDHQSSFELLLHPSASHCHFEWQHERVLQALMCQGQHTGALRYFHATKPPISSTSQAKLCLSVLLHNRCLVEAWSLLRQHSNHVNLGELLGFLYESCQELGLIKELLKLPLRVTEQECLEKFLQGTGGLHNRELLMVHYLQQANYIPALQLNQSLKMNLVNERDPKLKQRSNTRNCILDQYGKVLPRVQRKLAMERVKPYQHPHTSHKEVARSQPLSAVKRSANERVMSRAGFISNVLTKIEEVWLSKVATPQSSPAKSPRASEMPRPSMRTSSLHQPDPFLGTPITKSSRRKSRLMDLVVRPSCQTPRPLLGSPRPLSSWVSPKSITKAPELSLLQTPQVVKRARALAASGPVFSAFTPQSILRSSLRPTPVATPSASPGRSITPPLRSKENRITFIEVAETPEAEKSICWTNGPVEDEDEEADEDGERSHVKFLPPEGGIPSPQLRCSDSESVSIHDTAEEAQPSDTLPARLNLSLDASRTSVRSTDTTLEFYDAPLSEEQEGEERQVATENKEAEQKPLAATEQPGLTSDSAETKRQELKDETFADSLIDVDVLPASADVTDGNVRNIHKSVKIVLFLIFFSLSEEEEQAAAEAPPVFTSQKSTVSVTSSEAAGTDSHCESHACPPWCRFRNISETFSLSLYLCLLAVVSLNVSEELSRSESDDEEEEEEDESDQEEDDDEGKEEEEDSGNEGQGSSFMELKPSTTLLVPLELMEEQQDMATAQLGLPELLQSDVPDQRCNFSLMLDIDEDKETDILQMENDLHSSKPSTYSPTETTTDDFAAKPEVFLLGLDEQDDAPPGRVSPENKERGIHLSDGVEIEQQTGLELPTDLQAEDSGNKYQTSEDVAEQNAESVMLPRDSESAFLSAAAPTAMEELSEILDVEGGESEMAAEGSSAIEMDDQEDKPAPENEREEPVDVEEMAHSLETAIGSEEQQQDHRPSAGTEEDRASPVETEENSEDTKDGTETVRRSKDEAAAEEKLDPQGAETPSSPRKKTAPSTPSRMTTRGRKTVTFISPLPEEAATPVEETLTEAETISSAPASPSRTPRKSKPSKETKVHVSTPRRSTRIAHAESLKDQGSGEAEQVEAATDAQGRPSQRSASGRSSQRTRTGSEEPADTKTQGDTPRRSSRRTLNSSEVPPALLQEEQEITASAVKRSARKTKVKPVEEDEEEPLLSSSTHQSNRVTLDPQYAMLERNRKTSNLVFMSQQLEGTVTGALTRGPLRRRMQTLSDMVYNFIFRSKAAMEPPPLAEVELISPLPSPAAPPQRTQKSAKEGEAPTSTINLRRRRIMNVVFTKPVTRRKKL